MSTPATIDGPAPDGLALLESSMQRGRKIRNTLASAWMISNAFGLLRGANDPGSYRPAFGKINGYILAVMVCLASNALVGGAGY